MSSFFACSVKRMWLFLATGKRDGRRDEVAVLQRRSFVIQRVGKLRARLDVGDQGRTALHERDLCPARVQVLRNIVAAVAGADDEDVLALPRLAVVVLAGVQNLAAEVAQRRDIRKARNAADSGRHDDVSRMHLPLRAVRATQHDRPSPFSFVVGAALEFGGRPVVELHAFHIGLEPAGKFVFGNVGRPVRRKRHVRKVIDLHLVVQGQRVIAIAPVVADALFTVHDQRIDLQLRQACGDRKSGLSPAHDQHNRIPVDILGSGFPEIEPVGAAKIARIGLTLGP